MRSSSIYLAFSGILWAIMHLLGEYSARLWWTWYDVMTGDAPRWLNVSLGVICGVCGLENVFARAYSIVEAFVSLRLLPVAA